MVDSDTSTTEERETDIVVYSLINSNNSLNNNNNNIQLFSIGEKVLAFHTNCLYQAKVQGVEDQMGTFRYRIHYLGWKKSWDEWVGDDRLLKLTEENIQKQKELNAEHSGEKSAKPGRALQIGHVNSSEGIVKLAPKVALEKGTEIYDPQQSTSKARENRRTGPFTLAKGRKRGNDNTAKENNNRKLEKGIDLHIPSTLKQQLLDEHEFITDMGKLVKLPRNPNVDKILNDYLSYSSAKDSKGADKVAEMLSGLRRYFEGALSVKLLYNSERQQYQEAIKDGASPVTLYGAEHLLRLFVKLPELLAAANIDGDTLKELQQKLQDILRFLQRNRSTYFIPSFEKLQDSETIPVEQGD